MNLEEVINESKELIIHRNKIKFINTTHKAQMDEPITKRIKIEDRQEYTALDISDPLNEDTNDIKAYIRDQIKISERKVLMKMDRIEKKLNQLLALTRGENIDTSDVDDKTNINDETQAYENEEHIIEELVNDEMDEQHGSIDEYSSLIFPIADESTFDWFMMKLTDDNYRNNLVNRRWTLTRNVGTRSFNVSVKDFLRMHFDLAVCILYSVSGFGSRGTKKKKLDSKTLSLYVFDCFSRSHPNIYSLEEVSKAITQFWGRSQDTFTKMHDRALKREILN